MEVQIYNPERNLAANIEVQSDGESFFVHEWDVPEWANVASAHFTIHQALTEYETDHWFAGVRYRLAAPVPFTTPYA